MGIVVMCFWVSLAKASRTPKFGHPLTNPEPDAYGPQPRSILMTRSEEQASEGLGISNLGCLAFIHKIATASSFHLSTIHKERTQNAADKLSSFRDTETSQGEDIPVILTKHKEYINGTVSPSETNRPF